MFYLWGVLKDCCVFFDWWNHLWYITRGGEKWKISVREGPLLETVACRPDEHQRIDKIATFDYHIFISVIKNDKLDNVSGFQFSNNELFSTQTNILYTALVLWYFWASASPRLANFFPKSMAQCQTFLFCASFNCLYLSCRWGDEGWRRRRKLLWIFIAWHYFLPPSLCLMYSLDALCLHSLFLSFVRSSLRYDTKSIFRPEATVSQI